MFTGIVTHRGRVESIDATGEGGGRRRVVVALDAPLANVAIGDSVAVDGVCLTVVAAAPRRLAFDVIPETLRVTTLGERRPGDLVHLEGSLRVGDPLGGHFVQGHVDGTGSIVRRDARGEDVEVEVAVGPELFAGLLPKGSVALDGVSLTVGPVVRSDEASAPGGRFVVYLIPHTLEVTNFGTKGPGDRVNVEVDVLGRWVRHHLAEGVRDRADR